MMMKIHNLDTTNITDAARKFKNLKQYQTTLMHKSSILSSLSDHMDQNSSDSSWYQIT